MLEQCLDEGTVLGLRDQHLPRQLYVTQIGFGNAHGLAAGP